jgi:hypothetical protein
MRTRKLTGLFGGTLILLMSMFGGAGAQSVERADVTILNDHLHVHKVLVFDALGQRHMLGFVGHNEMKDFKVPSKVEALGPYSIALQQYLPLPGIGVPADEPPLKMTPVLFLMPGEILSIIVGQETALSSVEVVR